MFGWTILMVCAALLRALATAEDIPPSCDSEIYCQGELLHTVQVAVPPLFEDSKTFVDLKQKESSNVTLANFRVLMDSTGGKPTRDEIGKFVAENFEDGTELEYHIPTDWVQSPSILSKIADPSLRQWASDLNFLWKNLTRKVSTDVLDNKDKYSLLYLPNPFVIPGGRFKEPYYWDTYWIVRGLLVCDMKTTVKGILENFLYMQENYGIIPNGGRVYYLQRSQLPLLTPMIANYYKYTKDIDFIKEHIPTLESEFNFWMNNRTVQVTKNGNTYTLARYFAQSKGPRPESYREDLENAELFPTEERRQLFYTDIKSAAESGWDFSSRWFINNGKNNGNLSFIHTSQIIPVDLNSIIYWNADLLSDMFKSLGDISTSEKYANLAKQWKTAVNEVLWNEEEGSWLDYDFSNNIQRNYFYPSNIAPLWTGCYYENNIQSVAEKVVKYIIRNNITTFLGGIPASLDHTGEQWDWPNAWPPLQIIIIQGLQNTGVPSAMDLAYRLASTWVHSNYKGYKETEEMFEKYDANDPGKFGGGGEYTVQSGFGWTNGIDFELLDTYGTILNAEDSNNVRKKRSILKILSQH